MPTRTGRRRPERGARPARCRCAEGPSPQLGARARSRRRQASVPNQCDGLPRHVAKRPTTPALGLFAGETGDLPAEDAGSAFGPRLQAAVASLAVRNRISRRDTVELMAELFGARICAGSVDQILTRTAGALELPHQDLVRALRRSGRLNVDETGWRLRGARRTLWGAFTDRIAVYRIAGDRHEDRARELLGDSSAIVTSDRWWAYNHLPLARRQICWSHLQRDFTAHAEAGGGAEKQLGEAGLRVADEVFWAWEIYQHTGERKELKRRIRQLQRELKQKRTQIPGKIRTHDQPQNDQTRISRRQRRSSRPARRASGRVRR